ncbi:branched-chain amino acid ABC transporter substrate-binding protein [Uliginosibacterium sp. 31-16]|uniref:branched-chain amino acid ABC transporter substrate-binding protein n=1 Tax=Uliginosibacterium sp. 31-16 TaxID=3068315 RepID=UPI00273DDA7F|nr:branched-chain amino acid ABC transporter substrate-binding protein [Uliginosibacterium sp. 31-16]MDP5240664.1 branched-chain amino acid ABC transporter substrate-binding protein [Uliginosibacterium sp. 31-16]
MTHLPKLLAPALGLALVLAACSPKQEDSAATTEAAAAAQIIKIGFSAPLTGPQAHYGKGYQNGVQLAIDDVNDTKPMIGGKLVQFELVAEDDMADPKTATQVAQRVLDAGVAGVIGHFNSGTSIPASKVYSDAGMPQIAMATAPALTQQGFKTVFRSMTSDTQQGSVMGRYVVEKLAARKIAIIDDRTAYGQGLADEFEKAAKEVKGEIVAREFTNDKASDFMAILTSIKSKKPDAIFFGGTDAQSGPLVKQMRQIGMKAPLISGEMTRSDTFIKLAGPAAEGSIASLAGVPLAQMPGGPDFETRFKARFGEPEIYSPYGYDATRILIAAMIKADSVQPAQYLPMLAGISHAGVTAPKISYDTKGDLENGGITVYKVVGGKWEVLESIGGAQ